MADKKIAGKRSIGEQMLSVRKVAERKTACRLATQARRAEDRPDEGSGIFGSFGSFDQAKERTRKKLRAKAR